MNQHVVIRKESYVAGTRDKPEVGVFTQTHSLRPPVPWGRIKIGDFVWMKWSKGLIVAKAKVEGFRQIEQCTPEMLRNTTLGYKLFNLDAYWNQLPSIFFGMTIYLSNEEWLDMPIETKGRSYGESWIVLDTDELKDRWLSSRPSTTEFIEPNNHSKKRTRTISPFVRFLVLRRDNFTCQYCGRKPPEVSLQVDHIIPWSKGGSNQTDNLRTSCSECNVGKSNRISI